MKVVHVFNTETKELIYLYFIDDETGNKIEYTIEEFRQSIKQENCI